MIYMAILCGRSWRFPWLRSCFSSGGLLAVAHSLCVALVAFFLWLYCCGSLVVRCSCCFLAVVSLLWLYCWGCLWLRSWGVFLAVALSLCVALVAFLRWFPCCGYIAGGACGCVLGVVSLLWLSRCALLWLLSCGGFLAVVALFLWLYYCGCLIWLSLRKLASELIKPLLVQSLPLLGFTSSEANFRGYIIINLLNIWLNMLFLSGNWQS